MLVGEKTYISNGGIADWYVVFARTGEGGEIGVPTYNFCVVVDDYDMKVIYSWLKGMLNQMRDEITPPLTEGINVLGDFINSHIGNIVVVNGIADARTNMDAAPILEPRGELHVRYEPDTKRMFITVAAMRKHCAERQIGYRDWIKKMEDKRILVGVINKRMCKGMKVMAPAVRAIELDTTKDEFLRMDDYVPTPENADRESQLHD